MMRSVITGVGHVLPAKILSNEELSLRVETSDEWITTRTGIRTRHLANKEETTSLLASQAALNAVGQRSPDLILVATTTADKTFPSTAVFVQKTLNEALGHTTSPAFDIQAVCSGFLYALDIADAFILSKKFQKILVIGADVISRLLNWQDRSTCILFGDAAGAVLLEPQEQNHRGILATCLKADSQYADILCTTDGIGLTGKVGTIVMKGQEVFRHAVSKLSSCMEEVLQKSSLSLEDIDWMIPHQANKRILMALSDRMKFPQEKVICTVEQHGNTSAASIPLALSVKMEEGVLKEGDTILLSSIGGGLVWGAAVIRL